MSYLPFVQSSPHIQTRFEWKMNEVKEWLESNSGQTANTIEYGPEQGIGYSYGTWAIAYLVDKFGEGLLLGNFYPKLNLLVKSHQVPAFQIQWCKYNIPFHVLSQDLV